MIRDYINSKSKVLFEVNEEGKGRFVIYNPYNVIVEKSEYPVNLCEGRYELNDKDFRKAIKASSDIDVANNKVIVGDKVFTLERNGNYENWVSEGEEVNLSPEVKEELLYLSLFCSTDFNRYNLQFIYFDNDKIIASDGRILAERLMYTGLKGVFLKSSLVCYLPIGKAKVDKHNVMFVETEDYIFRSGSTPSDFVSYWNITDRFDRSHPISVNIDFSDFEKVKTEYKRDIKTFIYRTDGVNANWHQIGYNEVHKCKCALPCTEPTSFNLLFLQKVWNYIRHKDNVKTQTVYHYDSNRKCYCIGVGFCRFYIMPMVTD